MHRAYIHTDRHCFGRLPWTKWTNHCHARPKPGQAWRPLVTKYGQKSTKGGGSARDTLEGKGPQRGPQKRLGRRLEEVAKAVGGGYCRLQMPLRLALGVRETVAGHRLGALGGGGGAPSLPMHPWGLHS